MKTIIAGSRNITSESVLADALNYCDWEITEVVCGMCPGVDLAGKSWAEFHDIPVKEFPADWKQHGPVAGPIRNSDMIQKAINRKLDVLVLDYAAESSVPVKTRYRR